MQLCLKSVSLEHSASHCFLASEDGGTLLHLDFKCIQAERNRGRMPKRWMDNIKEDIKNLALRQAVDVMKDGMKWKQHVTISSSTGG